MTRRRTVCFREPGLKARRETSRPKVYPPSLCVVVAISAGKTPPPKGRGASIPSDHSAVRRDQISVKLSSPSPFTSEA